MRAGVADGATPLVVPGVVEEDDGADDRNGLAEDGPYRPPVGVASFAPIRKALGYARISRRGSRAPQRGGQLTVCWATARCCQKRRKPPSASWTPLATQPAGSRKAVSGAATRGEHRQRLGASATPSRVQCTKGVSIRSTTSVSTPWSTNRQPQRQHAPLGRMAERLMQARRGSERRGVDVVVYRGQVPILPAAARRVPLRAAPTCPT